MIIECEIARRNGQDLVCRLVQKKSVENVLKFAQVLKTARKWCYFEEQLRSIDASQQKMSCVFLNCNSTPLMLSSYCRRKQLCI